MEFGEAQISVVTGKILIMNVSESTDEGEATQPRRIQILFFFVVGKRLNPLLPTSETND